MHIHTHVYTDTCVCRIELLDNMVAFGGVLFVFAEADIVEYRL